MPFCLAGDVLEGECLGLMGVETRVVTYHLDGFFSSNLPSPSQACIVHVERRLSVSGHSFGDEWACPLLYVGGFCSLLGGRHQIEARE